MNINNIIINGSKVNSHFERGIHRLHFFSQPSLNLMTLQRLVEMDYLVVHSGDANGSDSLHAPQPMRADELLIR
ncbi:ABC-three component system middle component 2 [Citrobacter freundii]|uniref:ABC-three component system middle component 2 n=1 Tax=Citrobacter freundii TaxID=546 RepID=UPI000A3B548E|nr:ABC-three component system middle component 2 [Citrobacter freundii]MDE8814030.1 hypothetical protein [Citrobacter freundii]MDV2275717.1 ABC-three component system middle component 2 [Citrobacter freundii]MEB0855908.1 ABC-three component system middle component 2 [Citrobacter freundii]